MKHTCRLAAILFLMIGIFTCAAPSQKSDAHAESASANTRLFCLNIGKADAMLLFVEDKTYLIDTGYEHTWPALQTALQEFSVDHLDGVFLTHVHTDHEGGLEPLSESDVPVSAWYASEIFYDVKPQKHPAVKAAQKRGQEVQWLQAGDRLTISENAYFDVLGPVTRNTDNENNNSLVMKLHTSDGTILFTGDMKEEEEQELLLRGAFTQCDLLKVGHHGDNKATTQAFLNKVCPSAAVILTSTVEEPDTPAREILKRLDAVDCNVYISQDAEDGMLFTLENGHVAYQNYAWKSAPAKRTDISITMNVKEDTLTITNNSNTALLLENAYLYSSKGNDVFHLPAIKLESGANFVIGSNVTRDDCDYIAQKKRIWHETKRDVALLYDSYGRMLTGTDNGLSE